MLRRLVLTVVILALAGCGPKPKLGADQYYKEASSAFAEENWEVAINRYKDLLDQYPFSDHAEEAELRIAHAYYHREQYPEAIAAFNDFQRMHPMSPHLAEVYYLLGKSYMDQMTTTDRDPGAAENAHGWFRVVIDRYPEGDWAAKARRDLAVCRTALAEHELYIATFYLKRGNLRAGENRVKGIVEAYPDTTVATHALERLADAYGGAGDHEHERMARAAVAERAGPAGAPVQVAAAGEPALSEAGASPAIGTTTAASGPATAALLAELTARYGPGPATGTAAAPALVDPVPPRTGTRGDPRYGPSGNEPSPY